ncbi:hypothetical protein Mchl_5417 (plasmid) [Methylorubrum extorquens CM4]|uniref:Uncharacterized protein n=1 Tax=Methylorubrum extorquens (strain CM4 / NCIMB 13688) TaxID=440085 RepID=B7L2W6_METC4|nr:hypothetical protein Mchl_5417 [Methylorubrum extorquens CM4]
MTFGGSGRSGTPPEAAERFRHVRRGTPPKRSAAKAALTLTSCPSSPFTATCREESSEVDNWRLEVLEPLTCAVRSVRRLLQSPANGRAGSDDLALFENSQNFAVDAAPVGAAMFERAPRIARGRSSLTRRPCPGRTQFFLRSASARALSRGLSPRSTVADLPRSSEMMPRRVAGRRLRLPKRPITSCEASAFHGEIARRCFGPLPRPPIGEGRGLVHGTTEGQISSEAKRPAAARAYCSADGRRGALAADGLAGLGGRNDRLDCWLDDPSPSGRPFCPRRASRSLLHSCRAGAAGSGRRIRKHAHSASRGGDRRVAR